MKGTCEHSLHIAHAFFPGFNSLTVYSSFRGARSVKVYKSTEREQTADTRKIRSQARLIDRIVCDDSRV